MKTETGSPAAASRVGRAPSTSRAELSHIALQLFLEHGFEATTVDEVAEAAGIGRRTLFRYFPSKNDLAWGDFEAGLDAMRDYLAALPEEVPMKEGLEAAVLLFNEFPDEEVPFHRERMKLILNAPALVAHSTLRYEAWRRVVAEFAAARLGVGANELEPTALGWIYLGVAMSAYEQWLKGDDDELPALLRSAMAMVR